MTYVSACHGISFCSSKNYTEKKSIDELCLFIFSVPYIAYHSQRGDGALQVTRVELVPDVPTKRTELPSLLHRRVEERKSAKKLMPSARLGASLPLLLGDRVERSDNVGSKALRRLVRLF